jgi:hypothetical protein
MKISKNAFSVLALAFLVATLSIPMTSEAKKSRHHGKKAAHAAGHKKSHKGSHKKSSNPEPTMAAPPADAPAMGTPAPGQ